MRRFFISQLTRVLDFLKASESAHAGTQMTLPEKIDVAIGPSEPVDSEGADRTKPAAFFPDKPSARDYLDFHSYAATLADLIEKTQTPLTVGVFGAWGSGKTTLMRMIESSLRQIENDSASKRFVLVRFEAWKYYKEDALWRAMLLRVLDALRPELKDESKKVLRDSIEHLEQSLYRDVEWKEKGALSIDWPKLAKAGAGGALKLSFAFVPGVATLVEAVKAAQSAIGKGDIAGDVSAIAEAFQKDVVVHHRTQLRHIEQFQNEFSKLVKTHFAEQRLVIFVDDLDRCLPEKAIEVLEAIKLFLDVEGCVFVLGIDQEVITRGLEARYKEIVADGQSPKFSSHYIEKLIQLPFHLPPIEAREIGSYLSSLNVDWPHADCASVFAEALSPNPRQIKRTINVFMLLWKLAERRRSSLGAKVTALRLAKVVILQTAYPRVFDHLKSNGLLLKQLELLSRDALPTDPIDPILADAVKQISLKKLFQLLPDDDSANFADLELDELTAFFSLARRAPVVTENLVKEPAVAVSIPFPPTVAEAAATQSPERPFQLRSPVPDFVGREKELLQMVAALREHASIGVVTGMAGIGKTEFALLVAESMREHYPDGQLFVDLQGTDDKPRDPADALSACIRSLDGRNRDLPADVESLENIYRSHLNGKRTLIMLDNAAAAAQVRPLIPPKGSALLITSRNSLVLPAMTSISLDQLAAEDAMRLFKSISARVPEDVAAEICFLCGYLPPAVRAVASTLAATPDLDPAVYAQLLRDEQRRIGLLGTEGVNVSLEASFSLSYSRLPEETKRVFHKLSVFPEAFDAKAEEIVRDGSDESHLSELVKLSLVHYDAGTGRYRIHPLMRLFAQRHISPPERASVRMRHAEYYLGVVKKAGGLYRQRGENSREGLLLFDQERANIDAGFLWSAAHFSSEGTMASLCSDYAKHAREILESESSRVRMQWFVPALAAARKLGDVDAEFVHLLNLGAAYRKLGNDDSATASFTEALEVAEKSGLQERKAEVLSSLGLLYRDRGEIQRAIECFEGLLTISRELDDKRIASVALVNLGNTEFAVGETDKAIKYYDEALSIGRQMADPRTEGLALGNLGSVYGRIGDLDRGLDLYRQQLEISRKLGDRRGEAATLFNIALALQQKGELWQAHTVGGEAFSIYKKLELPDAQGVGEWLARLEPIQSTTDGAPEAA
jgi:tetratricopeptide (TPR) repeat protein